MLDRMNVQRMFPDLGARTYIMGVLNLTPDSFSDGGRFSDPEAATDAAFQMIEDGADIIDIGGESTRPGARSVGASEERDRVMPVIEALSAVDLRGAVLSIDTTKASVARAAVDSGVHLVNDISAMTFDPAMASTVAAAGVPVVLSHTRDRPEVMQKGDLSYHGGVVAAVREALAAAVDAGRAAGIPVEAMILDPGIGFGKTLDDNLHLLRGLRTLSVRRCPVLVGTSRKTFLGTLTGQPIDARVFATMASVGYAITAGADFIRVHDVAAARDTVRVVDALVRGSPT